MTMQTDDLEAIDHYMKETPLRTPAAQKLRDDWIVWYDGVGWYNRNFDSDIFDIARNKKNAFNLANAQTAAEKADIKESLKTALTSEEARGESRRMLSNGTYQPSEAEPFFPTRVKIAGGIAAAVIVTLWGLKKVYVDPFLRR